MNELTPADLLQVFPMLMYTWSMFILGWGIVTGVMFYRASKMVSLCDRVHVRNTDRYVLWLISAVNVFLTLFLLTYTAEACTSWIAVVNVFYTVHLLYVSVDVMRWWRFIRRCSIVNRKYVDEHI